MPAAAIDDLFADQPQAVDHRCLGCGQVHAGARHVVLVDGSTVSSYSEAWRLECEARAIMGMRTLDRRQSHLADIAKRRGEAAAEQIKDVMLAIWGKSKGAFGPQNSAA